MGNGNGSTSTKDPMGKDRSSTRRRRGRASSGQVRYQSSKPTPASHMWDYKTDGQVLRTSTNGKTHTRTSRVLENYVFERMMPVRDGWKIKQRVEFTPPPIGDRYKA